MSSLTEGRILRTVVSYLPSASLIALRELSDVPLKVRRLPHEPDYGLLGVLGLDQASIVDVGANRGQSVASIRRVVRSPRIQAFEPNPFLAARVEQRYPDVDVHVTALGDTAGRLILHIPTYGHTVWDTRASLDSGEAHSFLASSNFALFRAGRCSITTIEVNVETLDSFSLEPAFIKVDAEGFDSSVISGALETVDKHQPGLLIEDPAPSTVETLRSLGYEPFGFDPLTRDVVAGDCSRLNTFFFTAAHISKHGLRVR